MAPSFSGNLPRSLFINVVEATSAPGVPPGTGSESSFLTDVGEPFEAMSGHATSYIFLLAFSERLGGKAPVVSVYSCQFASRILVLLHC